MRPQYFILKKKKKKKSRNKIEFSKSVDTGRRIFISIIELFDLLK